MVDHTHENKPCLACALRSTLADFIDAHPRTAPEIAQALGCLLGEVMAIASDSGYSVQDIASLIQTTMTAATGVYNARQDAADDPARQVH